MRKEHDLGLRRPVSKDLFSAASPSSLVLRLHTTEKIMAADTKSMSQAWSVWDRIWADDRVSFLAEPEAIEKEFRSRSRLSTRSPKIWADAYILALVSVAGLKLVTFDRALRSHSADVLVLQLARRKEA